MKGLTDIPGIKVGHASDFEALTGCTAILCESGAVAGYCIRGYATGTQEMDVMDPLHITGAIHGVCLAGGSAFGLEAASGVRRVLEARGAGFKTPHGVVPIVPAAILYDLGLAKPGVRPTREMGEVAASAAHSGPVVEGCVGAGVGATCGKLLGMARAMKSGVGSFTVEVQGARVCALVVANPAGDILDPATGKILAGARTAGRDLEFANSVELMLRGRASPPLVRQNTTLAVVATDARLTKVQARRLAELASQGMVRAIAPVNTTADGDLVIALSLGSKEAPEDALGLAAAEAVAQSIARAARLAKPLGGLPGLGS